MAGEIDGAMFRAFAVYRDGVSGGSAVATTSRLLART